tara:strand:+ start:113 stop:502 length:390 start_codon:yes stop_codon:yes gene_type:complete
MANFAELDSDNVVIRVVVIEGEGAEGEAICADLYGGNWKQTSFTGSIRYNFAGVGFTYDAERDAFISTQPFPSWTLNEETCIYESPIPHPSLVDDFKGHQADRYYWDEDSLSWIKTYDWNEETSSWSPV